MALLRKICEKIILIIVTISILIMFCATPASYAKLDLKDGEFYYSGTTKGTYTVKEGIFSWLLDNIGQIADWLLGIMTMGFRMVFVGWTALIEKLLTWALETTVGVNVEGEEVDGMSSTNLSSITDSSNNVTVQAIVYNQVPAFDINFFNDEYDKTVSGTGTKYKCDKCGDYSEKCCTESGCSCECNGNCDGCKKYLAALAIDQENNPPIVVQIKNGVATWYYIMRFLSLAAMLVVLIGIGIKMVISTIASEKAVYKRMLVDWVIGMIILFAIHYLMIFIININEYLVEAVKNAANEVNTVEMKQLAPVEEKDSTSGVSAKDGIQKTNEDLEIDVYEATRTRAYDAKLSNGLTGMVMYMALVYFAIRYSIIYIQRYLTLIVLTLMGPPVGVAYALQKVFSGKSSTLKTWMTEYVMNVIIQTVHAIIYGVFISTALVLSLESVAGTIVALILMNYGLKAEKTFRKIFKMGEGDSLLGHTADAGDQDKLKQNIDAMTGLVVGAKPAAKALMNSPYAKALKGVGKIGAVGAGALAAGGVKVGKAAKNKFGKSDDEKLERAVDREMDKNGEGSAFKRDAYGRDAETEAQYDARRNAARAAVLLKNPKLAKKQNGEGADASLKELLEKGEDKLKNEVVEATNNLASNPNDPNAKKKFDAALGNYEKYKSYEVTTGDIAKAHGERLIDIKNTFDVGKGYNPLENVANIATGIFGTKHKDLKTGKYVSDHNGYYENFKPSNLLGLTADDKKVLKEQLMMPMLQGLGGMGAMFVGMGTLVANPMMGVGLLVGGANAAGKVLSKPAKDKKYNGRYGHARFGTPTIRKMEKEAVKRANREWDKLVTDNVKNNHPALYSKLKNDIENSAKINWKDSFVKNIKNAGLATVAVGTLGAIGGGGIAVIPLAGVAGAGFMSRTFINHSALGGRLDTINQHVAKQFKKNQLQFVEDSLNIQASIANGEIKVAEQKQEEKFMIEEFKKQGYKYDPKTGTIEAIENWNPNTNNVFGTENKKEQDDFAKKQFEAVMIELYAAQGMKYDPKTGLPIPNEDKKGSQKGVKELTRDQITEDKILITDRDIRDINAKMDKAILAAIKNNKDFNINSEQAQNDIIKEVEGELKSVLNENTNLEEIFKGGKKGLVEAIKDKSSKLEAKNPMLKLSDDEKASIQNAINELSVGKKDFSEIKAEDVMSKLKFSDGSQKPSTKDGSKQANSSNDGSSRVENAVAEYVKAIQSSKVVEPPEKTRRKTVGEAKESVKKSVEKRRKKIQDILNSDIENLDESNVKEIVDEKNLGSTSGIVDSTDIVDLLLMRKELQEINDYGSKELKLEKGVLGYKQAVKDKTKAAMDYYGAQLELKSFERDNPELFDEKGRVKFSTEDTKDLGIEKREKVKKIKDIQVELEELRKKKESSEETLKVKGPIIDIKNNNTSSLFDNNNLFGI